ncbi:MAG: hypothetical protein ABWY25_02605 [Paenisporosarcina sp.]
MTLTLVGSADSHLIEKWDSNLRACQQARINFEYQWHQNMAFFFGRHWVATLRNPNGGFSLVEQTPKESFRVRHTANRILRIVRTEVTKLSKEEPQFYCLPKSTEEKDRLAAMAGDSIAEYILRTKYFNRKRLLAIFWASLCGTSYIKNYYNAEKTDIDGIKGRIDFDVVTAFHLFVPNLQTTEIEEQPYVIHALTKNPEDVYNEYGVELEPDTDAKSIISDSRFIQSLGIKQNSNSETSQIYVKEVYVKPNKEFPNGAMFCYACNKLLYVYEPPELDIDPSDPMAAFEQMMSEPAQLELPFEEETKEEPVGNDSSLVPGKSIHEGLTNYRHEYPYRHGRFPFVKIDHIPTGMWYAESVIKSLIPMQKEYNKTRSLMLENRNMSGKPQWSYVMGAFDPKKFTGVPGLLLAIHLGFEPPRPLEQPPLPPNVTMDLEVTLKDMDDASSQFEVTKGRTPPGVEAASAIAYLSEENDTVFYHTVQSLENAVQETGVQVLANVHDYWPPERIVRMTSKNQFLEVREFSKQDLNPIMDFRVETGSMAPRSLAAKQAFITELYKTGAIEAREALRYLQMSETNKLYDDLMIDERHVQRENVYMSQGQPLYKPEGQQIDPMTQQMTPVYKQGRQTDPSTGEELLGEDGQPVTYNVTVNPYDDHEIHIMQHQKFQKTQEYELLPPDIQKIIQDHVDEHKMEMLKERNAIKADQLANSEEEVPPPREIQDERYGNAGV